MKKVLVVCLLLITICCFVFTGCFNDKDLVSKNVSERIDNILKGENENYSAEISYGKQEFPYVADGNCGNVSNVVNISIIPKKSLENFEYKFSCDGGNSNGILTSSLLKDSYTVTVKGITVSDPASVKLFIKTGESNEVEVKLSSVISESMMTSQEAFELAKTELKEQIDSLKSENKFSGEICIRLINESALGGEKYYWYVAIVKTDKSTVSVLIEPATREVKVKKIA